MLRAARDKEPSRNNARYDFSNFGAGPRLPGQKFPRLAEFSNRDTTSAFFARETEAGGDNRRDGGGARWKRVIGEFATACYGFLRFATVCYGSMQSAASRTCPPRVFRNVDEVDYRSTWLALETGGRASLWHRMRYVGQRFGEGSFSEILFLTLPQSPLLIPPNRALAVFQEHPYPEYVVKRIHEPLG